MPETAQRWPDARRRLIERKLHATCRRCSGEASSFLAGTRENKNQPGSTVVCKAHDPIRNQGCHDLIASGQIGAWPLRHVTGYLRGLGRGIMPLAGHNCLSSPPRPPPLSPPNRHLSTLPSPVPPLSGNPPPPSCFSFSFCQTSFYSAVLHTHF